MPVADGLHSDATLSVVISKNRIESKTCIPILMKQSCYTCSGRSIYTLNCDKLSSATYDIRICDSAHECRIYWVIGLCRAVEYLLVMDIY